MIAPRDEFYPSKESEIWALFDIRIPGAAERLNRERAAWQAAAGLIFVDPNHAVLIIRPGGAERLTR